jgi:hypothetical protein
MTYQASSHHSFDIKLARNLNSVDLAIIVHHFQYWINKNQELGRNFIDGRTWTYQTREEIAAHFPYFSSSQVRRFTDKLVELKILKKGNYNKSGIDKTIWYSFENEEMFTIGKIVNRVDESVNRVDEIVKAIPNTITKTKNHNLKGIVLDDEQTLPLEKEKEVIVKGKQKFPISKIQRPYFEKMKSLDLGSDDETLIIIVRDCFKKGKVNLLDKAISHIQAEMEKGTVFKKPPIALFRSVLNGKISPISEDVKKNKSFAERVKTKFNWSNLDIRNKFVICQKTLKEVHFDQDYESFKEQLAHLHELSKNY